MGHGIQSLLGGVAAVGLGLATFMGRFEPSTERQPFSDGQGAREERASPERASPERPRRTVDVAEATSPGRTTHVAAGGDLQAALDGARPGDAITLDPGATYRGPFRLPRKEGSGWIVIRPRTERGLPPPGQRVAPSHARLMPKLVAAGDSVVETDAAAHHYRLEGLEIAPADGVFVRGAVVQFGAKETDVASLPHHLIIDRCYIHGDPRRGTRRGVAVNSRETAVVNSYVSDFKEVGADSQAIAGWNGAGPFKIANNYLEAAGENVMFGGADPSIPNLVPGDIEIVRNHLAKPLRWKENDPAFEGTAWAVKNLFELKNAERVLVDGNLFEYNWPHAQNGFAILFTPRNQDGHSLWSVVEDVTFANNVVRHVAAAINVLGHDDIQTSQQTRRIAIENNLFVDVGGSWGGGRLFQLLDGTSDVLIDHNTAFQSDTVLSGGDRAPHTGFVFQNNIALNNSYGILGEGTGAGRSTLERYFPRAIVRRNVIVGASAEQYPPDNFFPASIGQVGFAGPRAADFRLAPSSAYKHAGTDRRDVGVDMDALEPLLASPSASAPH